MRGKNAWKRFTAFLLALALIFGEMPAISAQAEEYPVPDGGVSAFSLIQDVDYENNVAFSKDWADQDPDTGAYTAFYANLWYGFEEESQPTLAEFAAAYSQLDAAFQVTDISAAEPVNVTGFTLNVKSTTSEEYAWPYCAVKEENKSLSKGQLDFTADVTTGDLDPTAWKVEGISLEMTTTDGNATLTIHHPDWVEPTYVAFTGTENYDLFDAGNFCQDIQFSEDWCDRDDDGNLIACYANAGQWFDSESTPVTLADFAAKYCSVKAEFKIPGFPEGSDARVKTFELAFMDPDDTDHRESIFMDVDLALTEGNNSFTFDLTALQYDEKYADFLICGIDFIIKDSNPEDTFTLYGLNTEVPITPVAGQLYVTEDFDWDKNQFAENPTIKTTVTTIVGEGINMGLFYYDEELALHTIDIAVDGILNSDLQIYYQTDESAEKTLCQPQFGYDGHDEDQVKDPVIWPDESYKDFAYWVFSRVGIYTIKDTNLTGEVTINCVTSGWDFYDVSDNHLMTSSDRFERGSGQSIVMKPEDPDQEYSMLILASFGYGSWGDPENRFVTATDASGNDITDSLTFTSFQDLTGDSMASNWEVENVVNYTGALVTLTGPTTLTLTDEAHSYLYIIIRYEGEEGTEVKSYEWRESDASLEAHPRECTAEVAEGTGYCGYILNKAEYMYGDIDWNNGKTTARYNADSMKGVIDGLTGLIEEGLAENYGYLWIETGYVVNDPEGKANAKQEQYLSTAIDGAADIKGILLITETMGYSYNFEFTASFKKALKKMADKCGWKTKNGDALWYQELDYTSKTSETVCTDLWYATNVADESDRIYLIGAADNEGAFYLVKGDPDAEDPVLTLNSATLYIPANNAAGGTGLTIKVGNKYYKNWTYYALPTYYPKLHIDATNEVYIKGSFEAQEGDSNIFMNLAEGSTSIINGETYTMGEDGKIHVTTRDGEDFAIENGVPRVNTGTYENWFLGTVSYDYSVLVDKLDVQSATELSEDSYVTDASVSVNVDSLYDQISTGFSEEDQTKIDGGNNISLEAQFTDVDEADVSGNLVDQVEASDFGSAEYVDILMDYFVGYGADETKTAITETDSDITVSFTLTGEDYSTDVSKYSILRQHGETIDTITPESVTAIDGGVVVTFKTNKFSTYAVLFGDAVYHEISYDLGGAAVANEAAFVSSYKEGTSLLLPTAADFEENPDYVFGGWYTSKDYKEKEKVTEIPKDATKDYVLYAKWTAARLTVNFNGNGNTKAGKTSSITLYNQKRAALPANGFKDKTRVFMGWALTADADEVLFPNKAAVTVTTTKNGSGDDVIRINDTDVSSYVENGAITLYAVWDNTFVITYMNDGDIYDSDIYTYGTKKALDTSIKSIKPGYTFAGWYNEAGKQVTAITKTMSGDITLTARWKANTITVKYNKNAASGVSGKMADSKLTYDVEAALRTNAFTRPGYKFLGWSMDKTATEAAYADAETVRNLAASGTLTLYAVWAPTDYTITFRLLCKTSEVSGGQTAPMTYSYSKTTGSALPTPIRTGYTFAGWYKELAYKNQVKTTKGLSSDLTVYAKWTVATYDISYNGYSDRVTGENGTVTGTMTTQKNVKFTKATALQANQFSYEDASGNEYAFMGWDIWPSGDTAVYKDKQKVSNPDTYTFTIVDGKPTMTLYAVWRNSFYVTYQSYDGATTYTYQYGTGVATLPEPVRDGYTFGGWYKDAKFKTKVTNISASSKEDITLYAKWTAKTYKVTFNSNAPEGEKVTGSTKAETLTYGTSKALTKSGYKINGYTFLGWSTDPDATEPEYTNAQKVTGFGSYQSAVTLYAVWSLTEYTVTYKMGGVMDDVTETYTIKSGYTLRTAPAKMGYTFKGFFTDAKYKKAAASLKAGTTGNKVIYVKWAENK